MSLLRYREYKDSGVPWLGNVPKHWEVRRFKWLIERNDGGVWGDDPDGSDDTIVLRSTEQTVDGRWQIGEPAKRKLTERDRLTALLEVGDLLLTKSSGSALHIGKTTLVDEDVASLGACYSNFMQRLRVGDLLCPKLGWYVLNNGLARVQLDLLSNSTTGLANLNGTIIGELLLAWPPQEEQAAIVTFLDRETGKIDALIAEQEKLLLLLAEKRQATISHAVTKGLNPAAPMKDSGVVWLGDVPAHWKLTKLKYLANYCGGGTPNRENPEFWNGEIPWVSPKDMKAEFIESTEEFITEKGLAGSSTNLVPPGRLLMVVRSGILKHTIPVAINRVEVSLNQDMKALEFDSLITCRFILRWIQGLNDELLLAWSKQGATVESIEHAYLSETDVPLPSEAEQTAIVEFLELETVKLDALKAESERAIALLKERRSALIAAAVTGQIDVRNEVLDEKAA